MASYLVTRHRGAVEWARRRGIDAEWKEHFKDADLEKVRAGDRVMGPLPVQLIAAINAHGASYLHIEMTLPEDARRKELTADDMERYGAALVEYRAERIAPGQGGTI